MNTGRILVDAAPGLLDVLDADGSLIAELPLAHGAGAMLAGDVQVAALDHGSLVVDTLAGQTVAQRTLPAKTSLEGLSGGVVAYTNRFRQHLLRLADGRDLTVESCPASSSWLTQPSRVTAPSSTPSTPADRPRVGSSVSAPSGSRVASRAELDWRSSSPPNQCFQGAIERAGRRSVIRLRFVARRRRRRLRTPPL